MAQLGYGATGQKAGIYGNIASGRTNLGINMSNLYGNNAENIANSTRNIAGYNSGARERQPAPRSYNNLTQGFQQLYNLYNAPQKVNPVNNPNALDYQEQRSYYG